MRLAKDPTRTKDGQAHRPVRLGHPHRQRHHQGDGTRRARCPAYVSSDPSFAPPGTHACFTVGRPFMYALAVAGQAGVEQLLKATLADVEISLGLSGYKNLEEIQGMRDEIVVKLEGGPHL